MNGFWVVYALKGDTILTTQLMAGSGNFDDQDLDPYIWGAGLIMASNNTPFVHTFAPGTTRNFPTEGRIMVQVHVE